MFTVHPHEHIRRRRLGPFVFSERELKDLFYAWLAITVAFTILNTGATMSPTVFFIFLLSALTVGVGFLFHELAHRYVAQRHGCYAEFQASTPMLWLAILMSTMGFIFAAPGAVVISGYVDRRINGLISLAGPLVNLIIAVCFLLLSPLLGPIASYGFSINSWLAFFNLLPFGGLDGSKILRWRRSVYFAVTLTAFLFSFIL